MTPLSFLEFDASEDAEGHGSFDAMAAAAAAQLAALQAEVVRVLEWAHAQFGPPGPIDDGGEWDLELQGVRERATPLQVQYLPARGLDLRELDEGAPRTTISLTVSGTPAFCAAFRQAFGV